MNENAALESLNMREGSNEEIYFRGLKFKHGDAVSSIILTMLHGRQANIWQHFF